MSTSRFKRDINGKFIKNPTGHLISVVSEVVPEAVQVTGALLNSAQINTNGVLSSVEGAITEIKSAIAGVDNFTNFSNNVGGQSAVSTAGSG